MIKQQPTFIGTFEFLRLPVDVAHQFADLLDQAANNASTTPVVSRTWVKSIETPSDVLGQRERVFDCQ